MGQRVAEVDDEAQAIMGPAVRNYAPITFADFRFGSLSIHQSTDWNKLGLIRVFLGPWYIGISSICRQPASGRRCLGGAPECSLLIAGVEHECWSDGTATPDCRTPIALLLPKTTKSTAEAEDDKRRYVDAQAAIYTTMLQVDDPSCSRTGSQMTTRFASS